jgi:hypothetical protein
MRKGIVVDVTATDRARLEAVVANRNSPQKHVWRARIILLTADGLGTNRWAVDGSHGRHRRPECHSAHLTKPQFTVSWA